MPTSSRRPTDVVDGAAGHPAHRRYAGFHVLGRETFLVPVEWVDGWPVVGDLQPEMPRRPPGSVRNSGEGVRDDFDSARLHPRWVGVRRSPLAFSSFAERPGWLTVRGEAETLDDFYPTMVARRQQHHSCAIKVAVDLPQLARPVSPFIWMRSITAKSPSTTTRWWSSVRIGPVRSTLAESPRPAGKIALRIDIQPGGWGPDRIRFGVEDDAGNVANLAEIDGRYFSTQVATGFTGRVVGMYAVGCDAAFDWFDYEPAQT